MEQVGLLKCQNTATYAQPVAAASGNTPRCMPLTKLAEGMGADRCGEAEGAAGAQTCKGTNAREKMRVRGRRSKANAHDKYESQPFTGRDPGEALFKEGTQSNCNWHGPFK